MHSKTTHKGHRAKVGTAKKTSRIAKTSLVQGIPTHGVVIVSGRVSDSRSKTFRFNILSPTQQMRERNKAYKFFSID